MNVRRHLFKSQCLRVGVGFLLAAGPLLAASGCDETYATPPRSTVSDGSGRARTQAGVHWDAQNSAGARPLATFPAAIAVARVQCYNVGQGECAYSIVTKRDVEDQASVDALMKLPGVAGIAPIDPLLTSGSYVSDTAIRYAAVRLHADMVLLYTLDTQSNVEDAAPPLSLATLGFAPDQSIRVTSVASCVLLDAHNGYVYGVCEASKRADALTMAWANEAVIDGMTQQTQSAAFTNMCAKIQTSLWPNVLKNTAAVTAHN